MFDIKWHGHQIASLRVNQVPGGCVAGHTHCLPLNQVSTFAEADRLNGNRWWTSRECGKEDRFAVWQERGPRMSGFPFLKMSQRLRGAPRVRHLLEG